MDFIRFWQYADIQVLDIHNNYLSSHTKVPASLLSANGFIFVRRGSAQLLLDEQIYSVRGGQLFHAGSNSWIEWHTGNEPLEYIVLLYEAHVGYNTPSEKLTNMGVNIDFPYNLSHCVIPSRQSILYDMLEKMLELKQEEKPMAQFRVKALFYQWISHVLEQSHSSSEQNNISNPVTLVTMAMEYMLEHYAEPITLDSLATAMNCSPGHLSNRFKQILNRGPIDCLIHLRMKKASRLLIETQMSLRMIAAATSYQDVYYFSKAFKRHTGISPSAYRKQKYTSEDFTSIREIYDIVDPKGTCYIDNDNHYQYEVGKGESTTMFQKRSIIPASLLLAFGLLLGGCNSSSNSSNTNTNTNGPTESTTTQQVNTDSASAGTRTISTSSGDVEVPANAERIVTDYYVGHLLALGVKPIGSQGLYMQSPYLEGKTDGITDIGDNLEAIIDLKPDLIITGNTNNYESYSKIAPTVLVPVDSDVRKTVHQLGSILGKEDAAVIWEQQFDKQIVDARSQAKELLEEGETVTVFAGGIQKTITIYGKGYTGYSIYNELELPLQENIAKDINPDQPWMDISNELLADYAGDYIFVAVDLKSESYDYANDTLWGTLKAVKENKLFEIDGYRFWFSDPISLEGQVSDIVNMLSARKAENK